MPDIGIRMKTGIVVDFRQWEDLRKEPGENIVPLFYAQHIRNGLVHHNASGKEFDWITDEKTGLIQRNKDYVFCKRFTAKEERRRLQCGIYLSENYPEWIEVRSTPLVLLYFTIASRKAFSLKKSPNSLQKR